MPDIYLEFYDQLLAEAQMAGRDLALTVTRSGGRKSMQGGPDVAANVADAVTRGGQTRIGVHGGNENIVSSDLTDWISSNCGRVADADYTYNCNATSVANQLRYDGISVTSGQPYTFVFLMKKGTKTAYTIRLYDTENSTNVSYTLNGVTNSGSASVTSLINEEGFTEITVSFVAAADSADVRFWVSYNDSEGTFFVRDMRAGDSSAKMPAHLDGTGAGDTYGADVVTVTPTYGSVGTIYQEVVPYGWSDGADHPVSPTAARYFDNFTRFSAGPNGLLAQYGTGNLLSTGEKVTTDAINSVSYDWDSTTGGSRFGSNTRETLTGTIVPPLAETTIGNVAAGNRAINGILSYYLYNRVLPQSDFDELREGGAANWANYWT